MSAHCERVERFADGELSPDEAEGFRQHLLDCPRCQAELGNLLQLKMMASRHVERQPSGAQVLPPRRSFPRWSTAAAVGFAFAAVLAVVLFLRVRTPRADPWLASEPERRLEMRMAIAAVDHHRPLTARKMGQDSPQAAKLPLEALTELEREGDAGGMAAAFLVRNDKNLADQAQTYLEPLPSTPENETLRAVALLVKGAPEEALRHLDRALEQNPTLPQALWNKGLALRDLGLQETAALSFHAVAQQGEPGWAEEARQRAEALHAAEQARIQRWQAIMNAGQELAAHGTPPSAAILAERSPILRRFFYEAVRTRTSREQVQALLPLARELDPRTGGGVLARYVERIAARDFTLRAPLVQAYTQLLQGTLPPERVQAVIAELLRSPEDDLLMGALVHAQAVAGHLDAFEARAKASEDPWFQLIAFQERAKAQLSRAQEQEALQTIQSAHAICTSTPTEYPCEVVHLELAQIEGKLMRLDEAWEHAKQGWQQARAMNDRDQEPVALDLLARLAELRNNAPLARAYAAEGIYRRSSDR